MAYLPGSAPHDLALRFLSDATKLSDAQLAARYGPSRDPEQVSRGHKAPYYFLDEAGEIASVPTYQEFRPEWSDAAGRQYARGPDKDLLFVRLPVGITRRRNTDIGQQQQDFPTPREDLMLVPIIKARRKKNGEEDQEAEGSTWSLRVEAILFQRRATGVMRIVSDQPMPAPSEKLIEREPKRLEQAEERLKRKANDMGLPSVDMMPTSSRTQEHNARRAASQQHTFRIPSAPKAPKLH